MPAMKSRLIEVSVTMPKRISGIEGGMMMPITDETVLMAVACDAEYPCCFIEGIIMAPVAAVSATAEPLMPPKNMEPVIATWPSPPRTKPTRAAARSISRRAMPPWLITSPTRMKKGMARSGKLLTPRIDCSMSIDSGISESRAMTTAATPSPKAIGSPSASDANRMPRKIHSMV